MRLEMGWLGCAGVDTTWARATGSPEPAPAGAGQLTSFAVETANPLKLERMGKLDADVSCQGCGFNEAKEAARHCAACVARPSSRTAAGAIAAPRLARRGAGAVGERRALEQDRRLIQGRTAVYWHQRSRSRGRACHGASLAAITLTTTERTDTTAALSDSEHACLVSFLAERAGFEPAMPVARHTRFPGALLQPLGHLSKRYRV
jgi:hypothetical protein